MARQSKVVLSHITIPSNHSITFPDNAARDAWFDGRPKQEFPNLSYIRPEGIQVESILDNVKQYNFGYYKNEIGERIYFRVTNMVYLNENNTLLEIEKDVLMTYLPSATMLPSFIERSNQAPSSIFDADVPEIQYSGGFSYNLLDTFGTGNSFGFFAQISGAVEPEAQEQCLTFYTPKNFSDAALSTISFPTMFKYFTDEDDFRTYVNEYMTNGTADRIVSCGMLPAGDIAYTDFDEGLTTHLAIMEAVRQTKTVAVSTSLNTRIAKDNVTIVIAETDNFGNQIEIPISELSSGSLQLVSVSDPISQQRHYGVLSGGDGDNELKYRITINTGASLPSVNLPYYMAVRNIETDLSAQQTNAVVGGVSSAISNGVGGYMIAGPAGAAAGVAGAVLSTATNAVQNQVSASAALEKASRMAPTVSGVTTGFGVFANRSVGVSIFIKEPSGSGLTQLQDYYRFFGYNRSRVETPNVKSGTRFYVGNINGNFPGASSTDTGIIRQLFTSGVWLWEDEGSFFDY